ncbi:uncharacterized protein LOC128746081 [Sabethes cyaneus]|uniref:uncharacterized protein LOC128746081 n=1 Tax=Sabethes cyaneus TaxID=53552 RepID=UPI00237ED183|nr:uncharacterized protein LOC128746081 [Sabethes cyaneus]
MEIPSSLPFLLVTANVGSVFEDPSRLLNIWIKEFLNHVVTRRPAFIALHLQEVGGKTYEKSMEYVQEFIKHLCESPELADYNRIRVYLDEDYNSAEHFTALGNLYFAIRTIDHLQMWNFLTHEWETVEDKNIHTGNIEPIATKEKAKFPQQFFPECKWSRKGFLRTRWCVNGTVFDLVNIHLFHDASNLAACEEYPSVYCKSRRRALVHTLERFHKDKVNRAVPYFVFGDFNFRCDTEGVVKKLTEDLTMHRIPHAKMDNTKVQYRDSDGANVLTVGKKEFFHTDQSTFKENWLRQFDRELDSLRSILFEYPITFPPSYPYEEDPQQPGSYMSTRCPAWCDRILISPAARRLIDEERENGKAASGIVPKGTYGIIGESVCMGDHKPVYLNIRIKTSQGILNYCSCDTHAPKRVEHSSNNSSMIVNNNNNSCSSTLVSKPFDSSEARSVSVSNSNTHNNNHSIRTPTIANEPISSTSTPGCAIVSSTTSPAITNATITTTTTTPTANNNYSNNNNSCHSPLPNNKSHCSYCFDRVQSTFDQILSVLELSPGTGPSAAESDSLPGGVGGEPTNDPSKKAATKTATDEPSTKASTKAPLPVRISVFDTDSNANVCMCSLYSSSFSLVTGGSEQPKRSRSGSVSCSTADQSLICPNCRNIIKHQPIEHRKTLISRRLMLANDIIVNRIDTHYLNTYTHPPTGMSSPGGTINQFEPYTPESVESHSPVPESAFEGRLEFPESQAEPLLAANNNDAADDDDDPSIQTPQQQLEGGAPKQITNSVKKHPIANNNATGVLNNSTGTISCGGVSPRQLKSRLEKLKRISDRRKQYQQSKSANNSSGTLIAAVVADEQLTEKAALGLVAADGGLVVGLKEELVFVPGGGGSVVTKDGVGGALVDGTAGQRLGSDRGAATGDRKLVSCCQRHCCAIS